MESASSSPLQWPSGCCRESRKSRDLWMADSTSPRSASRRPNFGVMDCGSSCIELMLIVTPQSPFGSYRRTMVNRCRGRTMGYNKITRIARGADLPHLIKRTKSVHGYRRSAAGASDGLHDFRWETEANILGHHLYLFDAGKAILAEVVHDVLDENFGRGRSGGYRDRADAREPGGMDGLRVIDEIAHSAKVPRDFDKAVGVGAVG